MSLRDFKMSDKEPKKHNAETDDVVYFETTLLQLADQVEELEPYESQTQTTVNYRGHVPMISLQLFGGDIIWFRQLQVITIGREDRRLQIHPELDLAKYNGHHLGVSRYHAQISYYQGCFNVIDLASANGTKINGLRLRANTMYPIAEKDKLSFGLFDVVVDEIYRTSV